MNLSGFSTGKFSVLRSTSDTLVVHHSRIAALLQGTFFIVLIGAMCWFALDKPPTIASALRSVNGKLHEGVGEWFFLLIPLLMAAAVVFHLGRILLQANRIELDARTRTIRYGRKDLPFGEVQGIQLRFLGGGEGPDEHLLSLVLRDKTKLRVVSSTNRDRIVALADDVADMLGVPIDKAGGPPVLANRP